MALFVLCLVVIDIVILGGYTVGEAVRGNLGVRETPNREEPQVILGVSVSEKPELHNPSSFCIKERIMIVKNCLVVIDHVGHPLLLTNIIRSFIVCKVTSEYTCFEYGLFTLANLLCTPL